MVDIYISSKNAWIHELLWTQSSRFISLLRQPVNWLQFLQSIPFVPFQAFWRDSLFRCFPLYSSTLGSIYIWTELWESPSPDVLPGRHLLLIQVSGEQQAPRSSCKAQSHKLFFSSELRGAAVSRLKGACGLIYLYITASETAWLWLLDATPNKDL